MNICKLCHNKVGLKKSFLKIRPQSGENFCHNISYNKSISLIYKANTQTNIKSIKTLIDQRPKDTNKPQKSLQANKKLNQ